MRKNILIVSIMLLLSFYLSAQQSSNSIFANVPVMSGRVVFQQFIPADNSLSADQKYSLLTKWAKDNYSGNRMVSGIRFNEKERNVTVSAKTELVLPKSTKEGESKLMMNYRFDVAVTNGGLILTVRDITFQKIASTNNQSTSKVYLAEETITDASIAASDEEKEFRISTRNETLAFVNSLYDTLFQFFSKKS
ncbi:MAG TPA: DUF4468 domain-containing protein [Dysgonamonadaceae bacterium]|nr:DUF4468 domain-containing protein [Dysgonamonadaceae bacterium]HOV35565.1 DUF4468 domain-containing protein [Dysgonamonadaceae bacterium]HQG07860.1 DUF4468 domain-containing protein [Dysgonamonadaceae bacterium]HQI43735.1 DUF4468 domain-containing protein [Dysgonamonadaceae bacterium]